MPEKTAKRQEQSTEKKTDKKGDLIAAVAAGIVLITIGAAMYLITRSPPWRPAVKKQLVFDSPLPEQPPETT